MPAVASSQKVASHEEESVIPWPKNEADLDPIQKRMLADVRQILKDHAYVFEHLV